MASFVVGKKNRLNLIDPAERQKGMVMAGERINKWMTASPAKDEDTFFKTIYDEVTDTYGNFEVYYFDEGGAPQAIAPDDPNDDDEKKYNYTDSNGNNTNVKVRIEEDKKAQKRMTIVIPRDRGDVLNGGYVQTIIEDLNDLGTDDDKKKKYLLASIFLSRCH